MGWTLATDYAPTTAHTGYTLMTLENGDSTSEWTFQVSEHITGWRAGCECGWESRMHFARADHPSEHGSPPAQVDQRLGQAWQTHLDDEIPELRLHTLATRHAGSAAAVDAEVQTLRLRGISWETIGAATGITRQSAWERWRHLDIAAREASGTDTRPPRATFLPALDELQALASPHVVRPHVDPAVDAVDQAALGLRRMLAPTGPEETEDAVARLERATDHARAVHATAMGSVEAVSTATLNAVSADLEGVQVDHTRLRVYDGMGGEDRTIDVQWTGTDTAPVLRVGDRHLTDPVEVQRVAHALEILSQAAANTLYPGE